MIRFYISLVCVLSGFLVFKNAQPVASEARENSDFEIVPGNPSECLVVDTQLPVDLSFLEDEGVDLKHFQVMIADDTVMSVELLSDLIGMEFRHNTVTIANYYQELIGCNPKRLHDTAMLLLKKICETPLAEADQHELFTLMDYSITFIEVIERSLKRDYIALFQGYMFVAVIHNFGDAWFGMCCRKAFNLTDAHEDLERKDLVTQFVLSTQRVYNTAEKILRTLRQQAEYAQDYRFFDHMRAAFAPPPYIPSAEYHDGSSRSRVSPPPYIKDSEAEAICPPTYAEAKKALGL